MKAVERLRRGLCCSIFLINPLYLKLYWVDELDPLYSLMVICNSRDSICSSPVKYLMNVIYFALFFEVMRFFWFSFLKFIGCRRPSSMDSCLLLDIFPHSNHMKFDCCGSSNGRFCFEGGKQAILLECSVLYY